MRFYLLMTIFLSTQIQASECYDKYKAKYKEVNTKDKISKENIGDALTLAGISSSGTLITSVATPGMVLLGMASYGAGGYLSSEIKDDRIKYGQAMSLIKDCQMGKGYVLQEGTIRLRNYFADSSITEKEVATSLIELLDKGTFCSVEDLYHSGQMLLETGKRIIAKRGVINKHNVNDSERSDGQIIKGSRPSEKEETHNSSEK